MKKVLAKATRTLTLKRLCCGVMSGEYGALHIKDGASADMLQKILGQRLGDEAVVRVTVEVLKKGRLYKNPWLRIRKGEK